MSGTGNSAADADALHGVEPQANDPASPVVFHHFAPLDPDLREFQRKATEEVVIMMPQQPRIGIYSYGLSTTCRRLADRLLEQVCVSS
jgi:hypothetical protein